MNNIDEARKLILFWMRQKDGGYYPTKIGLPPMLVKLVDGLTAQKIYEEEIAKIEKHSGPLPRWDSDRNEPVAGTPKP